MPVIIGLVGTAAAASAHSAAITADTAYCYVVAVCVAGNTINATKVTRDGNRIESNKMNHIETIIF